ncbi:MAG TPA: DUF5916 domain-containing protein [Gemmatimonadales bacterium]|nr:DUF5916 domain-containing protein [Gemmatimonadales bacterium]
MHVLLLTLLFAQHPQDAAGTAAGVAPTPTTTLALTRVADVHIVVDGRLDEPAWAQAAVLRDFSQYLPNDNRPADDSTTVLVWYSPTAIYFGIRAYQDPASVRATLADRDNIAGDDYVEILLDTFNDRRQALVFGVNPLGVQADGTLRDAARQTTTSTSAVVTGAYTLDLSPDYVYESKGHLTSWGYEVELRIPFKTLRYQARDPQDWGLNVIRVVQATGHHHTWTRVLQTQASFLAQSGTVTGLTDLRRGLVLDVTPEATSTVSGSGTPSGWHYGGGDPRVGVTARWGLAPGLTLNGTVRPDFSQVEGDIPQIQFDPRVALFYPEKRPFFLDGLELFQTPVRLIYTRRLVDPVAAVKLTGKVGGTTVAALSGVDGTDASASGVDHPLLNAVRLRQDMGGQDNLGVVYTHRLDGSSFNHVAAADGHLVLGAWALDFQGGGSVTRASAGAPVLGAPLWRVSLVRSGRSFGLNLMSYGVGDDFRVESGFISRSGLVQQAAIPSYTIAGAPGSWLESFTVSCFCALTWDIFRHFAAGNTADDRQADMSTGFALRGGWQVGAGLSVESFGYPAPLFANDWIERVRGSVVDTIPFTGTPRLPNLDWSVNLQTPNFQNFSLSTFYFAGRDDNFFEWANAHIVFANVDLIWRPTGQLRTELLYNHQQVNRLSDGSTVSRIRVPRLKVEYQLSRPIFIRLVGQYTSNETDALRDDSRTGGAILLRDPTTGAFTRTVASVSNVFRVDWLFSYRPIPGTVLFAGYGGSLDDTGSFRFRSLARTADGFFIKLSYLFRA